MRSIANRYRSCKIVVREYVDLVKELGVVEGMVLQAKLVELKRWMMN